MSQVQDLVSRLCRDGVPFQPLSELLDYEQPGKYLVESTQYNDSFPTPVLTAGQTFILGYTDETTGIYPASEDKPVVIFDDFTTAFKWVDFPFKAKSSAMKMLVPKKGAEIDFRFVYYAMRCIRYTPQDHARQWISTYSTFRIPVPPLEVQREIVRILDQFTHLEAELEAELKARRRQYDFYRSHLMSFDANVERIPLVELATIGTGSRNTNEADPNGLFPFFVRSQLPLRIGEYEFDEQALITAGDGVGVGKVFHFVDGKYALHQRAYRIVPTSDRIEAKFLYYFFRTDFARYLEMTSVHASVTSLRRPMFEKYLVPVPPMSDQRWIVSVLDKFDALVNDLRVGLPAELTARRQQYEHYRDRLLTFKEAAA